MRPRLLKNKRKKICDDSTTMREPPGDALGYMATLTDLPRIKLWYRLYKLQISHF